LDGLPAVQIQEEQLAIYHLQVDVTPTYGGVVQRQVRTRIPTDDGEGLVDRPLKPLWLAWACYAEAERASGAACFQKQIDWGTAHFVTTRITSKRRHAHLSIFLPRALKFNGNDGTPWPFPAIGPEGAGRYEPHDPMRGSEHPRWPG
jgi:hypothetical protein